VHTLPSGQFGMVMLSCNGRTRPVQRFVCEIATLDHDDKEMDVVYVKPYNKTGKVLT